MTSETIGLIEAARLLNISDDTLRRRIADGSFPIPRLQGLGRRVLFSRSLFTEYLQGRIFRRERTKDGCQRTRSL